MQRIYTRVLAVHVFRVPAQDRTARRTPVPAKQAWTFPLAATPHLPTRRDPTSPLQILAGLVEERGIEVLFKTNPAACAVLSFIVRTGNTFLGS